MNDFDLGWLVGFVEGEGTFILSQDPRRPATYTPKIQVESTDKDAITKLQSIFPGRIWESNYPSKRKHFPKAKDSWRWGISSKRECKVFGNLILPHMSTRRQTQIKKMLLGCEYTRKQGVENEQTGVT